MACQGTNQKIVDNTSQNGPADALHTPLLWLELLLGFRERGRRMVLRLLFVCVNVGGRRRKWNAGLIETWWHVFSRKRMNTIRKLLIR